MRHWILTLITSTALVVQVAPAATPLEANQDLGIEGLVCGDHLNTVEFRNGLARFLNPESDTSDSISYLPDHYSLSGLELSLESPHGVTTAGEFSADYSRLLLHVGGPIGVRYLNCTRRYDSQSFTTGMPIAVLAGISRTPPVLVPALGVVASTLRPEFQGEHCNTRVVQVWYTSTPSQTHWQSMIPRSDGTWYFNAIRPYYILFELSQSTYQATSCTVAFTLSTTGARPGESYVGSIIYTGGYAGSERINLPFSKRVREFRAQISPSCRQHVDIIGAGIYSGNTFSTAVEAGTRDGRFVVNRELGLKTDSIALSLSGPKDRICIIPIYVVL